jgi:two-component system, response regulator YesN
MSEVDLLIIANIVVPILCGVIYFLLAKHIAYIAPLRKIVTGDKTYKWAYWGFIFFGLYLLSRPLQILLGPHPMPLVVNNIREFFMLGLFTPAVFLGLASFSLGYKKISDNLVRTIFGVCLFLAVIFIVVNIFAIGGSREIFRIGNYPVYDGVWFHPSNPRLDLMPILFIIRLINPVFFMLVIGVIAMWSSITYPKETVYTNMGKKLFFQSLAVWSYGFSMLSTGFMVLFWKIPNQWWMYYIGALAAGIFESISLSLPLHKDPEVH